MTDPFRSVWKVKLIRLPVLLLLLFLVGCQQWHDRLNPKFSFQSGDPDWAVVVMGIRQPERSSLTSGPCVTPMIRWEFFKDENSQEALPLPAIFNSHSCSVVGLPELSHYVIRVKPGIYQLGSITETIVDRERLKALLLKNARATDPNAVMADIKPKAAAAVVNTDFGGYRKNTESINKEANRNRLLPWFKAEAGKIYYLGDIDFRAGPPAEFSQYRYSYPEAKKALEDYETVNGTLIESGLHMAGRYFGKESDGQTVPPLPFVRVLMDRYVTVPKN